MTNVLYMGITCARLAALERYVLVACQVVACDRRIGVFTQYNEMMTGSIVIVTESKEIKIRIKIKCISRKINH